jgi:hypothetical protein
MRRWHNDYPRTLREWKKHYLDHVASNVDSGGDVGRDPFAIDCVCDAQKGRFRKKRAFDCGGSRCHICHADKYPIRKKSRRELIAELELREGFNDAAI